MKETMSNFIGLLIKGDFFLVFLIIMILVVVSIVFYLVKIEINDRKYDEDDEDASDNETLFVNAFNLGNQTENITNEEEASIKVGNIVREEIKETSEPEIIIENNNVDLKSFDKEVNETKIVEPTIDDKDILKEKIDIDNLDLPNNVKDVLNEIDSSNNEISEYEDDMEASSIISASELDERLKNMRATKEMDNHEKEIERYEKEQEEKAIISYDELIKRAKTGVVNYESKEDLGGVRVSKVDFSNAQVVKYDSPYLKEEKFLEGLKEFRKNL